MNAIVIALLALMVLRVGAVVYALTYKTYPRSVTWTREEDAMGLWLRLCVIFWCVWELWK